MVFGIFCIGLLSVGGILMECRYRGIKRKPQSLGEEQKFAPTNYKKEYILCAAIKRKTPINVESKNYKTYTLEDDDIYSIEIGRRHNDIIARFGKDVLCLTQQGFYTSFGRFVSREEALQIAKEAGQVKEPDSGKLYVFDKLYSEDLY